MSTEATTPAAVPSENILSTKMDIALSNAIVKAGLGFGVGVVASAILFRRRPWPVLMGLGFGAGQGYSDAERIFNPASIPGYKIAGSPLSGSALAPYTGFNPFSAKGSELASEIKNETVAAANEALVVAKDTVEKVEEKVAGAEKVAEKKVEKLKRMV